MSLESPEGKRRRLIADLPQLEYGQAFLEEIRERMEKTQERAITQGRICDEDFKLDVRYLLGRAAAYKEILELPGKMQLAKGGGNA